MRTIGEFGETTTAVEVRDGAIAISVAGEVPLAPERVLDASVDFSQRASACFLRCRGSA
jgi:hypothetical protein